MSIEYLPILFFFLFFFLQLENPCSVPEVRQFLAVAVDWSPIATEVE